MMISVKPDVDNIVEIERGKVVIKLTKIESKSQMPIVFDTTKILYRLSVDTASKTIGMPYVVEAFEHGKDRSLSDPDGATRRTAGCQNANAITELRSQK
ncbi:hypothetical protein AAF712_003460 [Marasmius tenuissimus]|uniref:Uncharacterized protein n=1 Tax=Marasmius tenuissimus TaxID=585030 RepID=A0ABR3A652_9AGAR